MNTQERKVFENRNADIWLPSAYGHSRVFKYTFLNQKFCPAPSQPGGQRKTNSHWNTVLLPINCSQHCVCCERWASFPHTALRSQSHSSGSQRVLLPRLCSVTFFHGGFFPGSHKLAPGDGLAAKPTDDPFVAGLATAPPHCQQLRPDRYNTCTSLPLHCTDCGNKMPSWWGTRSHPAQVQMTNSGQSETCMFFIESPASW